MEFSEFATKKLLQETGQSEHLTDREKHLIGLAVTATRGCIACTGGRLKRALEAGISYEALVAGIDLAAAVNAGVTVAIATQGAGRNGILKPELVTRLPDALGNGLPERGRDFACTNRQSRYLPRRAVSPPGCVQGSDKR